MADGEEFCEVVTDKIIAHPCVSTKLEFTSCISHLNSTEAVWSQVALTLCGDVGPAPLKQVDDGRPAVLGVWVVLGQAEPQESSQNQQLHGFPSVGGIRQRTGASPHIYISITASSAQPITNNRQAILRNQSLIFCSGVCGHPFPMDQTPLNKTLCVR